MAMIKCKECGKDISDKSSSCIHCGCPVISSTNNGNLRIIYSKDSRALVPKIQVSINGNQLAELKNGSETELTVNESGTLLFKGSFRKAEVEFDKDKNYKITLGWNTLTGKLMADVERW